MSPRWPDMNIRLKTVKSVMAEHNLSRPIAEQCVGPDGVVNEKALVVAKEAFGPGKSPEVPNPKKVQYLMDGLRLAKSRKDVKSMVAIREKLTAMGIDDLEV